MIKDLSMYATLFCRCLIYFLSQNKASLLIDAFQAPISKKAL